MHEYLRHQVLERLAKLACSRPRATITIAVLLAALAVWVTATGLVFQPDRNALVSREVDWNARYLDLRQTFSFDDLTVIVALPEDGAQRAKARIFIGALAGRLQQSDAVAEVHWRIDTQRVGGALARMQSIDEFGTTLEQVEQSRPLLQSPNLVAFLQTLPGRMRAAGEADGGATVARTLQPVVAMVQAIEVALRTAAPEPTGTALGQLIGPRYRLLESEDGNFAFIQIRPRLDPTQLEPAGRAVQASRLILEQTLADFPQVEAGLTGVPVIEADETRISRQDATWASMLAIGLIAVMLVIAFHSFSIPLLAVGALLIGVSWSFGYLTLAIGHLQLLSVIFTVVLLGLGIDFGIHLISQFETLRDRHPAGVPGFCSTMSETMQTTGPGIVTGAITTAVAFAAMNATDFTGMAEMGHIAAVGIGLCLAAMLTVLPSLMRLVRPRRRHVKSLEQREVHLYKHGWFAPFHDRPWTTVILATLIAGVGGFFARQVQYDYNLVRLLPDELDSVQWMNRVDTEGGLRYAASVVRGGDLEEVRRRAEAFRELSTVARVRGVGMIEPPNDEAKRALIRRFAQQHPPPTLTDPQPATPEQLRSTVQNLLTLLRTLGIPRAEAAGATETVEALRALVGELEAVQAAAEPLSDEQLQQRLAMLNAQFIEFRTVLAEMRAALLDDRPLTLDDLPITVRRDAIAGRAESPTLLMQIFPAVDVSDEAGMAEFVNELTTVDPEVTGSVVQIYYSSDLMVRSFAIAGLLGFLAVFALVYLDLQTFGDTWGRWFLMLALMVVLGSAAGWMVVNQYATPAWWPLPAGLWAPGVWLGLLMIALVLLIDRSGGTDALLCLLPVVIAFLVLMGVMGFINMPINPANIMVLPLLFGIGVDSGVHMVHRYRAHPDEDPPGLAGGTGKGIMLTGLTTIVGFGSLMIARHHGIFSLGLTLALGVFLTLAMCMIVMPALLTLRIRYAKRRGARSG